MIIRQGLHKASHILLLLFALHPSLAPTVKLSLRAAETYYHFKSIPVFFEKVLDLYKPINPEDESPAFLGEY